MGTRIPLSQLRDLKCRHCKHFLSCGPVYVTPDCGLLCGRCRALAKPNFRNYVYEELANTFVFPCLNWEKHCPEEGPWNTLKDHEIDCPYSSSCGTLCVNPSAFFSSKRTLPNEENLLYLEVPEKCLNLVSCKNCGKYLSCDPVHITIAGSNICHRCYLSNGVPPQTLRNLAYEKLANIFRFPCIFRAKGCPMKLRFGRDSWEHEVNCYYRDVQMSSAPETPELNVSNYHQHLDNSGYRPSVDGCYSMASRNNSRERPTFELPRVSAILRDHDLYQDNRLHPHWRREEEQAVYMKDFTGNSEHNHKLNTETQRYAANSGKKEINSADLDKLRIPDKERGIIPTHTGHVYATLTKNSLLFAPPQIQPNKNSSNGQQVTREFQEKIRNSLVGSNNEVEKLQNFNTVGIPTSPGGGSPNPGAFQGLTKSYMRDLENFNEDYAPVVKEYVQFNPNNNVQRNESLTIGNPDIIAELKMRNNQRRKNKQEEEDNRSFGIL